MATQINTPAAVDAQYPAFTGFQTQDPRTINYNDAAALMPLIYGVQINQLQCEILKLQEVASGAFGSPWIETASDSYTVANDFGNGTRFLATPATAVQPVVTLPAASVLAAGQTLTVIAGDALGVSIETNAADTIYMTTASGQTAVNFENTSVTLTTDGVDKWYVVAGFIDVLS